MIRIGIWLAAFPLAATILTAGADAAEPADARAIDGRYVGSTPDGEPIREFIELPADIEPPLRWSLSLARDAKTGEPARYRLRIDSDAKPAAGQSAKQTRSVTKDGAWSVSNGSPNGAASAVVKLDAGLAFAQVSENLLHPLNREGRLMVGDGGHSYTLCRADAAEKQVDPALTLTVPDMSYTISPLATGDTVFGVFEGRTPYQGIARQLNIDRHAAGFKAKWRVTLYKDPATGQPTTYKVEGTLFRPDAREGKWTMGRGTKDDEKAVVFELAAAGAQKAIQLLQADDDVLFFLDAERRPLVGHADFSYTLNRRSQPPPK